MALFLFHYSFFNDMLKHYLNSNNKKSKITAVPTAFSLGGTIFGGSMTNSASTRKCCLQSCNFRFFPAWRNLFKSSRMKFEYMI